MLASASKGIRKQTLLPCCTHTAGEAPQKQQRLQRLQADLCSPGAESGHHAFLAATAQPVCCAPGSLPAATRGFQSHAVGVLLLCCLPPACQ